MIAQLFMIEQGCQIGMLFEFELGETIFSLEQIHFQSYCDAEMKVEIATDE